MDAPFKKSLFGFKRADVVKYIFESDTQFHKTVREIQAECDEYRCSSENKAKHIEEFKSQISALEAEIANKNNIIAVVENKLKFYETQLEENKQRIDELQSENQRLVADKTDLANEIANKVMVDTKSQSDELIDNAKGVGVATVEDIELILSKLDLIKDELKETYRLAQVQLEEIINKASARIAKPGAADNKARVQSNIKKSTGRSSIFDKFMGR